MSKILADLAAGKATEFPAMYKGKFTHIIESKNLYYYHSSRAMQYFNVKKSDVERIYITKTDTTKYS